MAAGDATWNPLKGVAFRVTFPILDADGDLVTGATGLDSEVSKDGGTFADCTNEATEIATNSGMYYLDLTATEMNADTVAVIVKTTSSGAKTTPLVMYPLETADLPVNVVQISGDSTAADNLEAAADGTGYNLGGGLVVAASVTGAVGSVTGNVGGNVVGSVASVTAGVTVSTNSDKTGYSLATAPPTAAQTATAVRTELATELGRIDATVSSRMATFTLPTHFNDLEITANGHVSADVKEIANNSITASSIQGGAITAAKLSTDAIGADALAADAVAEIANGLLDLANGIEAGLTLRQALRLDTAALVGKLSGAATTTVTIRDTGDTKARITTTVDADGNRTAVTTDAT